MSKLKSTTAFIGLVVFGLLIIYFFYSQFLKPEKASQDLVLDQVADSLGNTTFDSIKNENIQKQLVEGKNDMLNDSKVSSNKSTTAAETGAVRGKLCYPSEQIPSLDVFIREIENNNTYLIKTSVNQGYFEFSDIPVGKYTAFAYPAEDSQEESFGGAYTPAVECGLSIECEDHSLTEFNVLSNKTTTNIDICDYYGAKLPDKESIVKNLIKL